LRSSARNMGIGSSSLTVQIKLARVPEFASASRKF
jgi:hypothetical protein